MGNLPREHGCTDSVRKSSLPRKNAKMLIDKSMFDICFPLMQHGSMDNGLSGLRGATVLLLAGLAFVQPIVPVTTPPRPMEAHTALAPARATASAKDHLALVCRSFNECVYLFV
jgi:hypothetical protein